MPCPKWWTRCGTIDRIDACEEGVAILIPPRQAACPSGFGRPGYWQLQRGVRSAEASTQRATCGAEQVTWQPRPRDFTLHDVVPMAPPILWLLVLLLVLVETSPL